MQRRPSQPAQTRPARLTGAGSGEYPCHTERELRRRARRCPTVPLSEAVPGLPAEVTRYLDNSTLSDLLDALALNPLERAVAEARLAGASVREIAAQTGLKKWRVERALAAVRRQWRAAQPDLAAPGPVRHDAGWQGVYLSETRRRGKR